MLISPQIKERAKSRIFENLAHALQSTNNEDWKAIILRAEEVLSVAKQLEELQNAKPKLDSAQ